jgi:predicted RNA binding protein YcfA (HicA-like mRNA interferase family)
MPKLVPTKPKVLIAKFQRLGFVKDHQTGSHLIMYNSKTQKRAVIPFHLKDLPKGTLSHILKEAGISLGDFLEA